ncbi:MAG TPA: hypothetical protein VFX76_06005, partial [Roseiflexaceae bacterium]|nr:hypothetical protein [Roseiflexaceae bacterium]
MQQIETPDGVIFDFTLPQAAQPSADGGVLGEESAPSGSLWFPLNPVVADETPPPQVGVLGIEDIVGGAVTSFITRRVVQMLKSPIQRGILEAVKKAEGDPKVLRLTDSAKPDELFQPIEGFEAWRALLPPGAERRVLLFVHGFASSVGGSHVAPALPEFGPRYDAILGYEHPTISRDPLQNARDLLALVPDDLRLSVDIITHSRGGLVARSLIELVDAAPHFTPRRLVTHGTPHGGTRLADKDRWDRLISLGLTAASWLATASGVAFWAPKLLEFVLKAAAQGVFELPGVAAMAPKGEFLEKLNAPGDPATAGRVRYAATTSRFSIFNVKQPGFRQAFQAIATQAFIDAPNDLVVPTDSMSAIDLSSGGVPADRRLLVDVDHFSYFANPKVLEFLREQLGGD